MAGERALREWVRRVPGVAWTEQARGGTVGKPDCEVPLPDGRRVPVELKSWVWSNKGLWRTRLRPAQVRWACRETLAGRLSLVMWNAATGRGSGRYGEPDSRWVAPAGLVPWSVEGFLPPGKALPVPVGPGDLPAWLADQFPPGPPPHDKAGLGFVGGPYPRGARGDPDFLAAGGFSG